jgi:hypothetical protein
MSIDLLCKQIAAEQAAFAIAFDKDKNQNAYLIWQLSNFLNAQGVETIADIKHYDSGVIYIEMDSGTAGADGNYFIPYGNSIEYKLTHKTGFLKSGFANANNLYLYDDYRYPSDAKYAKPLYCFTDYITQWDFFGVPTQSGLIVFVCNAKPWNTGDNFLKGAYHGFLNLVGGLGPVVPIALIIVGIFTAGAGTIIGQQIFAALGISSPVFAPVVGNIALQAALNGGNIQTAAKNAAISYAGSGFGAEIGGLAQSDSIGRVASAATTAALKGGNVAQAIILSGVANLNPDFLTQNGGAKMDYYDDNGNPVSISYDASGDINGIVTTMPDGTFVIENFDSSGGVESVYYQDANGDILNNSGEYIYQSVSDPNTQVLNPTPTGNQVQSSNSNGSITWSDVQNFVKLLPTISSVIKGQPLPGVRTATANGSQTPNKNGTVTTVVNGRVTTTRMPVGQAYNFPDGSYVMVDSQGIVHNISAQGVETISNLPSGVGGSGGSGALVMMGVALLLMGNK